jgi:hypothetical protein
MGQGNKDTLQAAATHWMFMQPHLLVIRMLATCSQIRWSGCWQSVLNQVHHSPFHDSALPCTNLSCVTHSNLDSHFTWLPTFCPIKSPRWPTCSTHVGLQPCHKVHGVSDGPLEAKQLQHSTCTALLTTQCVTYCQARPQRMGDDTDSPLHDNGMQSGKLSSKGPVGLCVVTAVQSKCWCQRWGQFRL